MRSNSPTGDITLSVSVLIISDGRVCLNFAVRDTGVGIAADQLPAIFRPFEQVGATDRRAGGTGLGLSISRQLIDLMDSTLKVESTLGEGSLFWFDLDLPLSHDQSNSGRGGVECVGYKGRAAACWWWMTSPPTARFWRHAR
jgi:signal transduction histidine kinase